MFEEDWSRSAYAGVEQVASFAGKDELLAYRRQLLERSGAQCAFLGERMPGASRLLDIGSGSGRVLFEMANRGMVRRATGIDISESRTRFAEEWCRDLGYEHILRFVCGSVFDDALSAERYDAAICLSGTFGYFDAIKRNGALTVLQLTKRVLADGGLFVIELYNHPEVLSAERDGLSVVQTRKELPEGDPFSHLMHNMQIQRAEHGLFVRNEKKFTRRDNRETDTRVEYLRLYLPKELIRLVESSGFTIESVHNAWGGPDRFDGWRRISVPPTSSIVVLRK